MIDGPWTMDHRPSPTIHNMIVIAIVICILLAVVYAFLQSASFGKMPSGNRLELFKQSGNYAKGQFQNLSVTPSLAEGVSYYRVLKEFFFTRKIRNRPTNVLPSKKTDLLALDPHKNILVWFGHSSYFIQVDGKKILVDPVFSGHASPVSFTTKSFPGSNVYTVADIPVIDFLLISHDHWDHMDYETILQLKPKIRQVITGLGTGAHLEHWGYDSSLIIEKDWNEEIQLEEGFVVHTLAARHFSGRGFNRNRSLWLSFVLRTPSMNFYLGGDSGYDTHFARIGEQYGPFDLAILECGQYNPYWKYIHMMPEEVVQAVIDLRALKLLPVHWAKFSLALHAWDEPIIRVTEESKRKNLSLIHPMIGEEVDLNTQTLFSS